MTDKAQTTEVEPKMTEAEAKELRELAKIVGYSVWKYNFQLANPKVTGDEMSLAWKTARDVQGKAGKKAVLALKKSGFNITKQ